MWAGLPTCGGLLTRPNLRPITHRRQNTILDRALPHFSELSSAVPPLPFQFPASSAELSQRLAR